MGNYHYKIKSTGANSNKFDVCEICKSHTSETFFQHEQKEYFSPITNKTELTNAGCNILFGHQDCLISIRK